MYKLEIQAQSLEDAKLQAFKENITVVYDATRSWKKKGSPTLTKDLNVFAANFLEEKGMFNFKDTGIIITISPGKRNTKQYPFKINKFKRKGRCKLTRTIEIRSLKDNILLGVAANKTEAISLAKEIVSREHIDLYGKTVYISSDRDFEIEYKPSKKFQLGQYIIFGVDEADVRLSKRKNRGFE